MYSYPNMLRHFIFASICAMLNAHYCHIPIHNSIYCSAYASSPLFIPAYSSLTNFTNPFSPRLNFIPRNEVRQVNLSFTTVTEFDNAIYQLVVANNLIKWTASNGETPYRCTDNSSNHNGRLELFCDGIISELTSFCTTCAGDDGSPYDCSNGQPKSSACSELWEVLLESDCGEYYTSPQEPVCVSTSNRDCELQCVDLQRGMAPRCGYELRNDLCDFCGSQLAHRICNPQILLSSTSLVHSTAVTIQTHLHADHTELLDSAIPATTHSTAAVRTLITDSATLLSSRAPLFTSDLPLPITESALTDSSFLAYMMIVLTAGFVSSLIYLNTCRRLRQLQTVRVCKSIDAKNRSIHI
ncbi:hypothetical protein BKA69DRAFT_96235 [Paraphysoderma sedebokerense]|nr:hypothetical protein BKA69DRAFT_96235 [Paraphysoderma sedebokerense]